MPPRALGITFERFPRGSCGDVTLLLGTHLMEAGLGRFQYVLGERTAADTQGHSLTQSHAWLEQDDLLVDITADQFGPYSSVIVNRGRTALHEAFDASVRHAADFRVYDTWTRARLDAIYRTICKVATDLRLGAERNDRGRPGREHEDSDRFDGRIALEPMRGPSTT